MLVFAVASLQSLSYVRMALRLWVLIGLMAYSFGRFSMFGFCCIKFICWNVCWLAGSLMPDALHFCNQISGWSWDDPGTLEGTRKDPVRSWLGFYRFLVGLKEPFWELLNIFERKNEILSYLLPSCLFWWFLSGNLGVWDCKNKPLVMEVLQKSSFAGSGFLMIPGSILHDFGWPWKPFSWLLLPRRLAWKLMIFHGDSGVIPDLEPLVGWG